MQVAAYVPIVYFMAGFQATAKKFWEYFFVTFLNTCSFTFCGQSASQ